MRKSFTQLNTMFGKLSQNETVANLALAAELNNDSQGYLLLKYFENETSSTLTTVSQQQRYQLPAKVSKLKTATVTVGQLRYTPMIVHTRTDWDRLNAMPYYSDIPQYIFAWDNNVEIFPIPSTTGNTITLNYKRVVPIMNFADYVTGTVSGTAGANAFVGTGTSWASSLTTGIDIRDLNIGLVATPSKGDGMKYTVNSVTDNTNLSVLEKLGLTMSGASYTLAQFPVLEEEFHDTIVYRSLLTYFSTIVDNPQKFNAFKLRYDENIQLLADYADTKILNIDLDGDITPQNPNLFIYSS